MQVHMHANAKTISFLLCFHAHDIEAGTDLYRATGEAHDLNFYGLIRKTTPVGSVYIQHTISTNVLF